MSHLSKLCQDLQGRLLESTIRCDVLTVKSNETAGTLSESEAQRLEVERQNAGLSERLERLACENAELRSKLWAAEVHLGSHEQEIERLQQQLVEAQKPSFLRRCR